MMPTEDGSETVAEVAADAITEALSALRAEIVAIRLGNTKGSKSPAMQVAALASKIAEIAKVADRMRRGEESEIRGLSAATLLTWVRLQTPEQRAKMLRAIANIDSPERKSVLA